VSTNGTPLAIFNIERDIPVNSVLPITAYASDRPPNSAPLVRGGIMWRQNKLAWLRRSCAPLGRSFAFCSVAPFIATDDIVRVIIVCSCGVILTFF
jgi:hypothetical protein